MLEVKPHENKTVSWWFSRRDRIEMSPPYQRKGSIWAVQDRAYLIDSILNSYDLPKLYLADFTYRNSPLNAKDKTYAVIDGKQRLLSIFEFMENKLPLSKNFILHQRPGLRLGGLYFKDLQRSHEDLALEFENFNLTVMSVLADTEAEISDLFDRLNRSKPLTGPEKRNAISSAANISIRKLAEHVFFTDRISFSTIRMQDLDLAARLLLLESSQSFVDLKKASLDKFVKEHANDLGSLNKVEKEVSSGLDLLADAFGTNDALLSTPGPIPLYYAVAKQLSPTELNIYRSCIVDFEALRAKARKALSVYGEASGSPEFEPLSIAGIFDFNHLSRNINDGSSLRRRVQILQAFIQAKLKNQ